MVTVKQRLEGEGCGHEAAWGRLSRQGGGSEALSVSVPSMCEASKK